MENEISYEERFDVILSKLNSDRKDDEKYFDLTGQLAYLVGNMIGHIEGLEIIKASMENKK